MFNNYNFLFLKIKMSNNYNMHAFILKKINNKIYNWKFVKEEIKRYIA